MRSRYLRATGAFVAAGLAVAACGSSSKTTSTPTTGSSGTAAPGGSAGTGTPITVGAIETLSGPLASSLGGIKETLQAWVDYTNANGGLEGHPVKLIVKDDAGSGTTGLADAHELIQQDHVAAIVDDESTVDGDWASAVASAGVPVVGGLAVDVPFLTNPDWFASSTNNYAAAYGVMGIGKSIGPKQAVVYCTENAACAQIIPFFKSIAPTLGMSIPYTQSVAATSPDFTAVCQALKSSGAQSYVMIEPTTVIERISAACRQQGVTAKIVEAASSVEPSLLTQPGVDGLEAVAVDFPFIATGTPATEAFHAALAKYAPANLLSQWGPGVTVPWVAMQLLAEAVKASGSGPVTPASIKTGLYTLKGDTLGGLAPPLSFSPGQVNFQNCYFTIGISHGAFVAPNGLQTSCAPDALIAGVAKAAAAG
ncbi:ABC transporter substrate-binding protein [Acidiferrimicrobium sp. IK]|uniref:ABC transporter substrate-binding protein n=1 Tax=Acidiferrimicrobium sp. IK TaxID=2871700 RepID=UPI0021CB3359|nr:ABC transporter substrate-binding protein [Acidiferrimicrobium sp. IK]MCU4186636.1 ABC transporter substrate-binding protein [Acidiferrimicrobium sp. IK]